MVDGGPPLQNLERILERYDVVMHGVSMGIGSSAELDWDYLKRLKQLATHTTSPWLSDHLCWTKSGNAHLHDYRCPTPRMCRIHCQPCTVIQLP